MSGWGCSSHVPQEPGLKEKNPERKLRSLILEAEWLRELNCNSQAWITLHRIAGKPGSLGTNGLRG
jgi:hypothetical protein